MRLFRHSKKADLNLSVQAIVILIFAVIMLGLGLGLINFIFGSAREKVGGALGAAQLTNPPSADDSLTMERNINIQFKGEAQVQIGYYNKNPGTKFNVEPKITSCKKANGDTAGALPTISTVSQDKVEPSGTVGWNAIIKLPDVSVEEGALTAGQYICKVNVYGTNDLNTVVPAETTDLPLEMLLESDQFFLKVTS